MANNQSPILRGEFDMLKKEVEQLHEIYELIREQTIAITKLAQKQDYMEQEHIGIRNNQDKFDKRLTDIEQKPVKRYDNLISMILSNIISLIVGAIAVIIGLKK